MGYTVSWTFNRSFTESEWKSITESVSNMFHRLNQVKGANGFGRPIVDNSEIIFNGDASKGDSHETFVLTLYESGSKFCKTARKPYDRFVKAVLVLANFWAPGALEVTCDGDNEADCWTQGVYTAQIYTAGYGRSPCSPVEFKKFNERMEKIDKEIEDSKSCDPSHSDPYKGVYAELDDTIKRLEDLATLVDHKPMKFLINYLKANIDDIKDAYTP
jgi:hypothetical protein